MIGYLKDHTVRQWIAWKLCSLFVNADQYGHGVSVQSGPHRDSPYIATCDDLAASESSVQ